MSFKAKVSIGGKEMNVLSCDYALHQETDHTGRPSSIVRGGTINLEVESTGETDIFEWMCNSFERKDGMITFMKRDSDAKLKELNWKEGYVIGYMERFSHYGSNPLLINFTVSAKEISMGSGTHVNEWPV